MTSLSGSNLPDADKKALASLGYTTLEGVQFAAQLEPKLLAAFLGHPLEDALKTKVHFRVHKLPLGVNLAQIKPPQKPFDIVGGGTPPPTSFTNIAYQGPIRNQGDRRTCVAFASSAVFEGYVAKGGKTPVVFSPQFLYYRCVPAPASAGAPSPDSGTTAATAFGILSSQGVCLESDFPYEDPDSGTSPTAANDAAAAGNRIPGLVALEPTNVTQIQSQIARGICVVVSLQVYVTWYWNEATRSLGTVVLPFPGETPLNGGHAVCIVGYRVDAPGTDPPNPGGGVFIIRNSQGPSFGKTGGEGAGYGTLPFAFLSAHAVEAYSIQG